MSSVVNPWYVFMKRIGLLAQNRPLHVSAAAPPRRDISASSSPCFAIYRAFPPLSSFCALGFALSFCGNIFLRGDNPNIWAVPALRSDAPKNVVSCSIAPRHRSCASASYIETCAAAHEGDAPAARVSVCDMLHSGVRTISLGMERPVRSASPFLHPVCLVLVLRPTIHLPQSNGPFVRATQRSHAGPCALLLFSWEARPSAPSCAPAPMPDQADHLTSCPASRRPPGALSQAIPSDPPADVPWAPYEAPLPDCLALQRSDYLPVVRPRVHAASGALRSSPRPVVMYSVLLRLSADTGTRFAALTRCSFVGIPIKNGCPRADRAYWQSSLDLIASVGRRVSVSCAAAR
ncbi:hypothetical protein HYPSUDRAFT_202313 [Hypholoma sublateritium FD-334 SS-4]|uniref:Uncharacterized protein n=1 Tax=Hypholoma sublateritium (strain FD-334 SS-4) TaxID=945553 RepID=A0A0D2PR08_HYPSF|nr:hypothetical protein HYPSUDRAFT_202313 [Hypholoma sublateritium FD-334 SS-4]